MTVSGPVSVLEMCVVFGCVLVVFGCVSMCQYVIAQEVASRARV